MKKYQELFEELEDGVRDLRKALALSLQEKLQEMKKPLEEAEILKYEARLWLREEAERAAGY